MRIGAQLQNQKIPCIFLTLYPDGNIIAISLQAVHSARDCSHPMCAAAPLDACTIHLAHHLNLALSQVLVTIAWRVSLATMMDRM